MIVVALDSGVDKTGYALLNKSGGNFKLITSGLIKTSKITDLSERLQEIYKRLNDVIKFYKPEQIILEQLFFSRNQKTAISVGQAQGVMMLSAAVNSIPVTFLTPLQIKLAITGYGQADKKSVRKMLELTFGISKKIKEDDEIDAIACGLAYCYLSR